MATKNKTADDIYMNDEDLALMRKYSDAWDEANAAGDEAGKNAAHDAAEQLRAKYGYSGGVDGSDYIKTGTNKKTVGASGETFSVPSFTYDEDGSISAMREQIMSRQPFSYDYQKDPLWSQYKKQYTREADRSAADALGKAAVMTGGMPSTAAIAASQQASDYQMSKMTDKIPELQQLAYSMYMDDVAADYDKLAMLTDAEDRRYNRYVTDRSFDYGVSRDAVEDERYANEFERSKALEKAELLAQYGDYSGYKALGYTDDEIAKLTSGYESALMQAARAATSGGGSGSSGSASTAAGRTWDDVDAYVGIGGNAEDYIKANYKALGYSSSSAAIAAYNVYKTQQKASAPKSVIGMDSLDYDPDEGIFTWNGTKYNSVEKLQAALNKAAESGAINDADIAKLKRYLNAYGFNA